MICFQAKKTFVSLPEQLLLGLTCGRKALVHLLVSEEPRQGGQLRREERVQRWHPPHRLSQQDQEKVLNRSPKQRRQC